MEHRGTHLSVGCCAFLAVDVPLTTILLAFPCLPVLRVGCGGVCAHVRVMSQASIVECIHTHREGGKTATNLRARGDLPSSCSLSSVSATGRPTQPRIDGSTQRTNPNSKAAACVDSQYIAHPDTQKPSNCCCDRVQAQLKTRSPDVR